MKRTMLVLLAGLFATSLCFADQALAPKKPKPAATENQTLNGTVKSVTAENAAKKIKSSILVSDKEGKNADCLVTSSTRILGKDGKPIDLSQLAAGAHVSIKYAMTREGAKEALKIKMLG